MSGRLLAISDLHIGYPQNRAMVDGLRPSDTGDWLIVAGDVGEVFADVGYVLASLAGRFERVIWTPGNHELWTTNRDPMQIFGRDRYDYLVNMCDELGVVSPEHPFPVWTERGGPATLVPLFLLYDYSFLPQGATTKAEGLAIAREIVHAHGEEIWVRSSPGQGSEFCFSLAIAPRSNAE